MSETKSHGLRYFSLSSDHAIAQVFWITTFAILTAVAAQIEIPNRPVPYTLQTLVVLLAGAMLGPRNGALSMVLYLGMGLAGFPVFSSAGFGLASILGPTGGYLLSFPVAAMVIGLILKRKKQLGWYFGAMAAGLLVIFTFGTLQLSVVTSMDLSEAFASGFLIFSLWDILKLVSAVAISRQFRDKTLLS